MNLARLGRIEFVELQLGERQAAIRNRSKDPTTRWRNSERVGHRPSALHFRGLERPITPQEGDRDVEEHFGRFGSYGPLSRHWAVLVTRGQ